MVNQKLIDYIKTCKSKGFSIERVRDHLLKNNYQTHDIEEAISYINFEEGDGEKKETKVGDSNRTTSITVIAWIHLISGIISIIFGISIWWIWSRMATVLNMFADGTVSSGPGLIEQYFVLITIVCVLFGILGIIIGWGLLKLKKLARMAAVVLSILNIISIVGAIWGILVLYFLTRLKNKEAFEIS